MIVYLIESRYQLKEYLYNEPILVQVLHLIIFQVPGQVMLIERHHNVELVILWKCFNDEHHIRVLYCPLRFNLLLHLFQLVHHDHLHSKYLCITNPTTFEHHPKAALSQHVLHRVAEVEIFQWHLDRHLYYI